MRTALDAVIERLKDPAPLVVSPELMELAKKIAAQPVRKLNAREVRAWAEEVAESVCNLTD